MHTLTSSPRAVGLAAGFVALVAVFLWLDRAWATDHDLYGTAAEAKMIAAGVAGLVAGLAGWLVARAAGRRAPQG